MRRSPATTLLVVFLTACSLLAPTATPPVSAPEPTDPPSTTAAPTTSTTIGDPDGADPLIASGCADPPEAFLILCQAVELVQTRYVDPIEDAALAEAALRGVEELSTTGRHSGVLECALPSPPFMSVCEALDRRDAPPELGAEAAVDGIARYALDPNSVYLDPRALELAREEQTGQVEGIGALVSAEDTTTQQREGCAVISDTCRLVIVATLDGSPAERAGLMQGDQIVAVDGENILGWPLDAVTAAVRGPAGTEVRLGILRDDERIDVEITRARIEIPVVEAEVVGEVGYLRLRMFTDNAGRLVREALASLLAAGVDTLILDLRNNPGGSLDAAIDVTSEFVAQGLVLRTQGPGGERSYPVTGDPLAPSIELIALVNPGSASGSEVVTGALQDADRALVVGEATFGKNTVQQRFDLPNGGALKLTIARWVTPLRQDFGGTGLAPDTELEIPSDLSPGEIVELVLGVVRQAA